MDNTGRELRRGLKTQGPVGPVMVVLFSPASNDVLSFPPIGESIPVQALLTQLAVETLDDAVLPRATRSGAGWADILVLKPAHHRGGCELGAMGRM